MAAPRYLRNDAGRIKMTPTVAASAGAADAEKVPSTNASGVLDPSLLNAAASGANKIPILDGSGRLDPSTLPTGVGQDAQSCPASESLAAGAYVNIWSDAGTAKARNADATAEGKEAHGFVTAAVASGATATVFKEGSNTGLSGLTPGTRLFLGTTPGAASATAPSAAGNVVQFVGIAATATSADFESGEPITVA